MATPTRALARVATPSFAPHRARNNVRGRRAAAVAPLGASSSSSSSSSAASPSPVAVPSEYVTLARNLVDAAGAITTKYFRTPLEIDDKTDDSPVTIADRSAEAAMRAMVRANFPSHAIFGEEEGIELGDGGESEWTWVFDPIDGTKSFITGKPLWGTLVALLKDGVPVLGVLDQPVLKERWVGVRGQASTFNGAPIAVRPCASIEDAYVYSTTPLMFEGDNLAPYERVAKACKVPMYGCDCYAYGLLASGHVDAVIEGGLEAVRLHGARADREGRGRGVHGLARGGVEVARERGGARERGFSRRGDRDGGQEDARERAQSHGGVMQFFLCMMSSTKVRR